MEVAPTYLAPLHTSYSPKQNVTFVATQAGEIKFSTPLPALKYAGAYGDIVEIKKAR